LFLFDDSGNLNMSNSGSILDNGTDAISFDGSANVTIPNGNLDMNGNNIVSSTDNTVTINDDIDINPSNTFSPTNDTTDRSFDADNTTTAELADVLATLIKDLGMDT